MPEREQPVAVPSPTSLASGRYRVERFLGEGAKKRVYLARGNEILVSTLTNDLVGNAADVLFDEGRNVELKGLEGTHRVFGVRWE